MTEKFSKHVIGPASSARGKARYRGGESRPHDVPFMAQVADAFMTDLEGGPTDVHKIILAQQSLREYLDYEGAFPNCHLPSPQMAAETMLADALQSRVKL